MEEKLFLEIPILEFLLFVQYLLVEDICLCVQISLE